MGKRIAEVGEQSWHAQVERNHLVIDERGYAIATSLCHGRFRNIDAEPRIKSLEI